MLLSLKVFGCACEESNLQASRLAPFCYVLGFTTESRCASCCHDIGVSFAPH